MKIPVSPPDLQSLVRDAIKHERLQPILGTRPGAAPEGKYRHWDTLRHVSPPPGLTSHEWWLGIKWAREALYVSLPLNDKKGRPFVFAPADVVQHMLMQIDRNASGQIRVSEQVTDPQTRDTYLIKGLMEEAITSSQLEGASTTREVAKDMIQRGRQPQTRDERMIWNNYQAMLFIRRLGPAPLTPAIIMELHEILTRGTLDDASAAGRFRTDNEEIVVEDEIGTVLHIPPPAGELPSRLERLCNFANGGDSDGKFIHPAVRAIMLHFWLAYDHPFVDGNGRTARALFYWAMATSGYWLCEYISISRILRKAPGKYGRSYLYTETDDNDATYFILYQLRVILRAIEELHDYLARKQRELQETQRVVQRSALLREQLNFRQLALIRHAMKHPGFVYTIESHRISNNISYGTARSDLLNLVKVGLLEQASGSNRRMLFLSPGDLQRRIARVA